MTQSRPFAAGSLSGTLYAGRCATVAQLDADPANRCLCGSMHVVRGTLLIAYIQLVFAGIMLGGIISVALRAPQEETSWRDQKSDVSSFFYNEFNTTDELISRNETVTSVLLPLSRKWNDMVAASVTAAIEILVSVCMLIGVQRENAFLLLPHIVISLVSLVISLLRTWPVISFGHPSMIIIGIISIIVQFIFYYIPFRAYKYLRAKKYLESLSDMPHAAAASRAHSTSSVRATRDAPPPYEQAIKTAPTEGRPPPYNGAGTSTQTE